MFENVNKELLEKAMQAKTKDEALAILREGGVELTDEDLKSISAGEEDEGHICWTHIHCFSDEREKCVKDFCPPYDPICPRFFYEPGT